jgi:hypothetical protein
LISLNLTSIAVIVSSLLVRPDPQIVVETYHHPRFLIPFSLGVSMADALGAPVEAFQEMMAQMLES